MKSVLQQVKDNSKQISNLNVNAAKTFEHNTREVTKAAAATVQDANSNVNIFDNSNNDNSDKTTSSSTHTSSNKKKI
jgi:hypothetical protein